MAMQLNDYRLLGRSGLRVSPLALGNSRPLDPALDPRAALKSLTIEPGSIDRAGQMQSLRKSQSNRN